MRGTTKWGLVLALGAGLLGGGWALRISLLEGAAAGAVADGSGPVPVEVAVVQHGPIERRREFSGTLEAAAEFVVSAKVGGRIERIGVDLSDVVQRGQVVAWLDDEEYEQAEAQARANLAVVRAQKIAADKQLEISQRNYDRAGGLRADKVISAQELDTAQAAKLAAEAAVAVASAEMTRAKTTLHTAQLRTGYTRVVADWPEGDPQRVVAARFADEGTTVAANGALLSIVDLDPVVVVVYVTERDYADLSPGQTVHLTTDAFGDEVFEGAVDRIAPVFREQSRQARVELRVPNPDARLKPGMFARATATLDRVQDATIVPKDAIVSRDGASVVFVVSADRTSVILRPVDVGIEQDGMVAVVGEGVQGEVVTLGQQQLRDGASISIPAPAAEEPP